jgi:hypothetical protein
LQHGPAMAVQGIKQDRKGGFDGQGRNHIALILQSRVG